MSQIITVTFPAGSREAIAAEPLEQWAYGQQLRFVGLDLPASYQVDFSNFEFCGASIPRVGNASGVSVPVEVLTSGRNVYAFIWIQDETSGARYYRATVRVVPGPAPDPEESPEEQSAVTEAINALNMAARAIPNEVELAVQRAIAAGDFSGVFWATYGETTSAEITEALEDRKIVLMEYAGLFFTLIARVSETTDTSYVFTCFTGDYFAKLSVTGSTWSVGEQDMVAHLASPAFSGTPTAPTAPEGTDTDQLATTHFVQQALTASGAAAAQNTIEQVAEAALLEDLPVTLTIGSGVNPSTGGNYNNQPRYSRTQMISSISARVIYVSLDSDEYEYVAWVYSGPGTGSAVFSPTNSAYTSNSLSFEVGHGNPYFRLGIQRKDHVSMTAGAADPTSDEYKLSKALKIRCVKNDEIVRQYEKNLSIAIAGGVETPVLKNNGLNASSGHVVDSINTTTWSNYADLPILLFQGDTITSEYAFVVSELASDKIGFVSVENTFLAAGEIYTAKKTGLFNLLIQNVTPDTDVAAVTSITHYGAKADDPVRGLPKNPYAHIAKDKLSDGSYVWSSAVKDIKSTCHLHVTRATHFMRAYNKGYDHLAISNYHASKPTVPIREIIQTLPGYDSSMVIRDSFLESPNAEHVYFDGTRAHLNSVGSFVTSGSDNTGVGEGGFDGTVRDFVAETEQMLKYPNGGGVTINHPYWSGMTAAEILEIIELSDIVFAMEIYNAASEATNGKGYSLDLWDEVLSTGTQIFGTAVPDHAAESAFDWENLPFGFNHMLCVTETEQEIMLAYRKGRFYTTILNDDLLLKNFAIDDSGVMTFKASKTGTITVKTAARTQVFDAVDNATFATAANDVYVRVEMVSGDNRLFTNAIML